MALTLSEAEALRTAYYQALLALASGQSYTIGSRTLTRANLAEVKKAFNEYDQLVTDLKNGSSGGVKIFRITPVDL